MGSVLDVVVFRVKPFICTALAWVCSTPRPPEPRSITTFTTITSWWRCLFRHLFLVLVHSFHDARLAIKRA